MGKVYRLKRIKMILKFFHILIVECRRGCPKNYRPVCGSDGITYDNRCELAIAACKRDSEITITHFGKCGGKHWIPIFTEFLHALSFISTCLKWDLVLEFSGWMVGA